MMLEKHSEAEKTKKQLRLSADGTILFDFGNVHSENSIIQTITTSFFNLMFQGE